MNDEWTVVAGEVFDLVLDPMVVLVPVDGVHRDVVVLVSGSILLIVVEGDGPGDGAVLRGEHGVVIVQDHPVLDE